MDIETNLERLNIFLFHTLGLTDDEAVLLMQMIANQIRERKNGKERI